MLFNFLVLLLHPFSGSITNSFSSFLGIVVRVSWLIYHITWAILPLLLIRLSSLSITHSLLYLWDLIYLLLGHTLCLLLLLHFILSEKLFPILLQNLHIYIVLAIFLACSHVRFILLFKAFLAFIWSIIAKLRCWLVLFISHHSIGIILEVPFLAWSQLNRLWGIPSWRLILSLLTDLSIDISCRSFCKWWFLCWVAIGLGGQALSVVYVITLLLLHLLLLILKAISHVVIRVIKGLTGSCCSAWILASIAIRAHYSIAILHGFCENIVTYIELLILHSCRMLLLLFICWSVGTKDGVPVGF